MATNKQREAARRKLERQLEARQDRARRRRRGNVIASVVGAVVVVVVIGLVIVFSVGDKGSDKASGSSTTPTASGATSTAPTTAATATAAPTTAASKAYPAAKGGAVSFDGVTVTGAADLTGRPGVTSKGTLVPKAVAYKDLVVGKGAAATSTSTVTVQYIGALYKNGTIFDESWKRGAPASFPLTGVVKGFSQGIGGLAGKIPAMRVGGRRIVIIPSALGYGATAQSTIPANSTLVFVIDLTKVAAA